jgi:hypothetical protein
VDLDRCGNDLARDGVERRFNKHEPGTSKQRADEMSARLLVFFKIQTPIEQFLRTLGRDEYDKNETPCVSVPP